MKIFTLQRSIEVPVPLRDVFSFFSKAENLEALTPPWVHYKILSPTPVEMRAGKIIEYRIKIKGFPIKWKSEITVWEPPHRFVDEQRKGPYRFWAHDHRFREKSGGTLIEDEVRYAVWGGGLVRFLFVKRDLDKIFDYRQTTIEKLFGRK